MLEALRFNLSNKSFTNAHTFTYPTPTNIYPYTLTPTNIYIHTPIYIHTNILTYTDAHTHACTDTYTYTNIYTHAHTNSYTHTHTHTPTHQRKLLSFPLSFSCVCVCVCVCVCAFLSISLSPAGWGCRIHWLHLCGGVRPHLSECPGYDSKPSDGESPALEIWEIWSAPPLLLILSPL